MSVSKRPDSPYYWYDFWIDGRRFRGSTGQTSRRAAEQAEREARERARQNIEAGTLGARHLTIDDVFGRYWSQHAARTKNAAGQRAHIEQILAIIPPRTIYAEIGNNHVADFIERRRAQGRRKFMRGKGVIDDRGPISDGTIANILTTWQAAHTMARDLWELPVRPIAWGKLKPRRSSGRISSITADKAQELLGYLPRHIQAVTLFTLATGCRAAQAFDLTYGRVDIKRRTATVQRQKRKGEGTETKQLNEMALLALAMAHDAEAGPDDLVFDITNWRRHWEAARTRAGLPAFRFHDLRHVFATWLAENGASLQATSRALGHSSINVTMRYLEVFERHVAEAVAKLPMVPIDNVTPMHGVKKTSARNE